MKGWRLESSRWKLVGTVGALALAMVVIVFVPWERF